MADSDSICHDENRTDVRDATVSGLRRDRGRLIDVGTTQGLSTSGMRPWRGDPVSSWHTSACPLSEHVAEILRKCCTEFSLPITASKESLEWDIRQSDSSDEYEGSLVLHLPRDARPCYRPCLQMKVWEFSEDGISAQERKCHSEEADCRDLGPTGPRGLIPAVRDSTEVTELNSGITCIRNGLYGNLFVNDPRVRHDISDTNILQ